MTASKWRLAGYVIEQPLGAGGSGEVWRARVRSTGEAVALKRIRVRDHAGLLAARSEAAILTTLEHRHLIGLRECVVDSRGDEYAVVLVLDLADGGSLAQLLDRRGRLTCGEAVTALAPIAAAIAYAHGAGVVHGDITPANILFSDAGIPLLADLGVARLRGELAAVRSTPAYLDPAVAAGGMPSPTSDVFMLGAVAVHVLTGATLWAGDCAEEVLACARDGDLSAVADRFSAAQVPEPVAQVVARALSADAAQRGTAAAFALDLRHSCVPAAVELTAGRADDPVARPAPTYGIGPSTRRPLPPDLGARRLAAPRRRLVVVAGAGCAVAALVGAVVLARTGTGGRSPTTSGNPIALPDRPATPARSTSAPGPSADPARTAPAVLDPNSAGLVLAELDRSRASAFAARNPALLAQVYAQGPLLAQDTALLERAVPVGCGLVGVANRYAALAVTGRTGARVMVQATVALAASTLVCAGSTVATAASSGPTPLSITLVRTDGHYLISDINRSN